MDNLAESTTPSNPPTDADLVEMIGELEQYRDRLVNETLETAKRAKLIKSTVMAQIEPELTTIDTALEQLRQQRAALSAKD